MRRLAPPVVVVVLALIAASCAGPTPAPTAIPTAVPQQPTQPPAQPTLAPTQPPAEAAKTAGELAVLGITVYKKSCGRCHDDPFAGPLSNGLRLHANAQDLLRFMQTKMPQDAPGSLPAEEYFYVLADVLVDGKVVPADAILDINKLADIALQK